MQSRSNSPNHNYSSHNQPLPPLHHKSNRISHHENNTQAINAINKFHGKEIRPDYIRPNDILYWDANQAGINKQHDGFKYDHKNRPFWVIRVNDDEITAIPITHTPNEKKDGYKSLYTVYNVKSSPTINKAINQMTGESKYNYFRPLNEVKVKKSTFASKQYPRRLGNLTQLVSRNTIRQQRRALNNSVQQAVQANRQFYHEQKIRHKSPNYHFDSKEYHERALKKEVLRNRDFMESLISKDYIGYTKEPFMYQPVNHQKIHSQKHQKYKRSYKHKASKTVVNNYKDDIDLG